MSQHSPAAYTWSIQVTIEASSKIDKIDSPSHKILLLEKQQEANKTKMIIAVEQIGNQTLPNKDFILLFQNEAIRYPSVTLGRNSKNQACAMISFVPNFANCQMDDAIKQSLAHTDKFPVDMDQARGEYIFLIDRSGSMGGQRIIQAKQALILFLKSLPTESLFNVISFGSHFELMFPKSVKYESQKLNQAIQQVENFDANFGGTEIYQPLQEIFKKPRNKGYPRQIFLLTDGCVSDEKSVIKLIKDNNQFNRVHAIGIGSGASNYLIVNSAKAGKGISNFVDNNQKIAEQVISMLEASLTPCLDNFIFKYDEKLIDVIQPIPSTIPCITKNQPFYVFAFFKQGVENIATQIELQCFDSCLNQNLQFAIEINENNCELKNEVYKLGINRMIKCLEEETFLKEASEEDIFKQRLKDLSTQLVNISVTNQVLSTKTAFICVVKTVSDEKAPLVQQQQKMQKVIIPTIESSDYYQNDDDAEMIYQSFSKQMPQMLSYQCGPKLCSIKEKKSDSFFKKLIPNFSLPWSRSKKGPSLPSQPSPPIHLSPPSPQIMCNCIQKNLSQNMQMHDFLEKDYSQEAMTDLMEKLNQYNLDEMMDQGIPKKQQQKQEDIEPNQNEIYKQQQKQENIQLNQNEIYQKIINEVQLQGYWQVNNQILVNIIAQFSDINILIPTQIKQINNSENIWMTILVLLWLEQNQANLKNEWILIEKKTINWLNKATNNQWEQYKQIALKQLK